MQMQKILTSKDGLFLADFYTAIATVQPKSTIPFEDTGGFSLFLVLEWYGWIKAFKNITA